MDSDPPSRTQAGASSSSSSFHTTRDRLQTELRKLPVPIRELLAGAVTGGIGKTCIAPLERLKILYQTGRFGTGASIRASLWRLYSEEGPKGLFKGNSASVARIVPYSSIHFGAFEYYRRGILTFEEAHGFKLPSVADGLAGSAAGLTAVIMTYPLDVVRARLALHVEDKPSTSPSSGGNSSNSRNSPIRGIRGMLLHTYQSEGVRGLYRGIGPTLIGIVPYSGIKFFVYQGMKRLYVRLYEERRDSRGGEGNSLQAKSGGRRKNGSLPVPVMLACGAAAGVIAQTATYPLDVVRRRMQTQGLLLPSSAPLPSFHSTLHGLSMLWRQQGVRSLFAGVTINYLKVVPSTAIGFTLYDMTKSFLGLENRLSSMSG